MSSLREDCNRLQYSDEEVDTVVHMQLEYKTLNEMCSETGLEMKDVEKILASTAIVWCH